jgi:hypothetical protein
MLNGVGRERDKEIFFAFETFVVEKYSGYVFTLNVYCNLFE